MNFERWKHLFTDPEHNPPWHMDWRHVRMIHAVLCAEKPSSVIEIGTHRGASTTAIIEAMEAHAEIRQALLVDYDHKIAPETLATVAVLFSPNLTCAGRWRFKESRSSAPAFCSTSCVSPANTSNRNGTRTPTTAT